MAIRFTCANPDCAKTVRAPDSAAGKKARCPACGTPQRVPSPDDSLASQTMSPASMAPEDTAAGEAPPPTPDAGRVCGDCGATMPAAASVCDRCGWVNPDAVGPPGPAPSAGRGGSLAIGSLSALRYAFSNVRSIATLVLYSIVLGMLLRFVLFGGMCCVFALPGGLILGLLGAVAAQLIVGGYFMRFYLDCSISSLEGVDTAPEVPDFAFMDLLKTGAMGLAIALAYIGPIVTIPLLPIALLGWAYTSDARALDIRWAAKAALRKPGELAVLWLIMLFWLAIMILGLWLGGRVVGLMQETVVGRGGLGNFLLALLVGAVGGFLLGVVFHAFMAAEFRCVGMLGRYNPDLTEMMPERTNVAVAVAAVAAGVVVQTAFLALVVWAVVRRAMSLIT